MRYRREFVWIAAFAVLVAFAVPWPLWGIDRVVAGLPVWIWWHVGWLGVCTLVFSRFARSGAWERGMGLDTATGDTTAADTAAEGGDRR